MHVDIHHPHAGRRVVRSAAVLAVALLALVAAACGSGETSSSASSTTAGAGDGGGGGTAPSGTVAASAATGDAVPSAGCGSSTSSGAVTEERRTLDVDGTERWYLITTPSANDGTTPLPVVFDWHGLMEGAQVHAAMSQYSALAAQENFIVVFPNGQGEPVRWDANPNNEPNADLAFFDKLYDTLGTDVCIDTSRVYSTGLSYGAIMTSYLMCERAERFAAVAPVDGLQHPEPCRHYEPLPIMAFHGTADPILSFNGGFGGALGDLLGGGAGAGGETTTTTAPPYDMDGEGYPATVATWAELNGCDPTPTDTVTDTGEAATPQIITRTYTCPDDNPVEFVVVVNGGHAWPGSEFSKTIGNIVGPTTFAIDATKMSWEFFTQHRRTS